MKSLKLFLTVTTIVVISISSQVQAKELRIGTASQGGAFYPVGQAIATLINKYAEGLTAVPIVTQGSVQNPRLVHSGEIDLGITNNNLALFANEGEGPYARGDKMDLVAVASLHFSILHMITLADSPINTFADIKGKRVAVGPAGGGTMGFLNRLLPVHDLKINDFKPSFLSYSDGFSQLADGNVDAAFALSGYPAAAVTQARVTKDLKHIKFTDTKLKESLEEYQFYSKVVVAKDVYSTPEDGIVLGVSNLLFANASMDEETINKVTRAIYDHMDEFERLNAYAKQIVPEQSKALAIPLHPGSARYFK